MKCMICGKECTGRTCSGACRARLSRRTRTEQAHEDKRTQEGMTLRNGSTIACGGDDPIKSIEPVLNLTRSELMAKIRAYPQDQWVNSPEHNELMRRLHSMTVEELEAQGYFIPQWKRSA